MIVNIEFYTYCTVNQRQIYMGGIKLTTLSIISNPDSSTKPDPEVATFEFNFTMSNYGYFTSESKQAEFMKNNNPESVTMNVDENNNDPEDVTVDEPNPDSGGQDDDVDPRSNSDSFCTAESITTPDESFSSSSSDDSDLDEIVVEHIPWTTPWHVNPWDWRPKIVPRKGTVPHPRDPRGKSNQQHHQKLDPRHQLRPLRRKKEPVEIPLKWQGKWAPRDPRSQAEIPEPSPSMERMHRGKQLEVRAMSNSKPQNLMTSIMTALDKLHCNTSPTYVKDDKKPPWKKVEFWPIRGAIPETPRSPTRPKGSRNVPVKEIIQAQNDPLSKRPRAPSRFKLPTSNRKVVKKTPATKRLLSSSSSDEEDSRKMDELIKAQVMKFKPIKKKKRLGTSRGTTLNITQTGKQVQEPEEAEPVEAAMEKLFQQDDPLAQAIAQAEIDLGGNYRIFKHFAFEPRFDQMRPHQNFRRIIVTLYIEHVHILNISLVIQTSNVQHLLYLDFDPDPSTSAESVPSLGQGSDTAVRSPSTQAFTPRPEILRSPSTQATTPRP